MGITIWALTDAGTPAVSGHGATGFDLPFVLATLLRTVMTTLGGGLVAWLAFRTWRRRRRAGPPPDSNGVEKSLLGRVVAVLIYGTAASVTGANMLYSLDPTVRDASLATWGKTATARVFAVEPMPDVHEELQHVRYQFRAEDGTIAEGYRNQFTFAARPLLVGDTVTVTYLPEHPATSAADLDFSLDGVLEFFGLQFTVFAVGVWGFSINSGLWRRRDDEPAMPAAPSEHVQRALRTPLNLPARPFGRRGGGF